MTPNSRSYLNRWLSPDDIIPDSNNPLDFDRYSYVNGNAINYNDPSGHDKCTGTQKFLPDCELINGEWTREWTVGEDDPYWNGDLQTQQDFATIKEGANFVGSIVIEPYDWYLTGKECLYGNCSPWMLLGLAPFIPSTSGKYLDDLVQLVPAKTLHWSQKGISAITGDGKYFLDDLADSMAQGWKGDPLKVLEIDGKLVSLDNRRLTVAKMLDIDVPITVSRGYTVKDLVRVFRRDGIFTEIPIRGTSPGQMIIDMFGRLIER